MSSKAIPASELLPEPYGPTIVTILMGPLTALSIEIASEFTVYSTETFYKHKKLTTVVCDRNERNSLISEIVARHLSLSLRDCTTWGKYIETRVLVRHWSDRIFT